MGKLQTAAAKAAPLRMALETVRACQTCAEYLPGRQWCVSWRQHTSPMNVCGLWKSQCEARDIKRTPLSPVRAGAGTAVTIGSKVYLPRHAVRAMGSPDRVAIEISEDGTLVIRPDSGPDSWDLSSSGFGTAALLRQLRQHGWEPGRYAYRLVGREIHIERGEMRRG